MNPYSIYLVCSRISILYSIYGVVCSRTSILYSIYGVVCSRTSIKPNRHSQTGTVVARRKKVDGAVKVNILDDDVTVSFADESSSTIRMKFRNLDRSNIMEWNDKDGEGSSSKDDDDDDDDDVVVLDEDDMMMDMD